MRAFGRTCCPLFAPEPVSALRPLVVLPPPCEPPRFGVGPFCAMCCPPRSSFGRPIARPELGLAPRPRRAFLLCQNARTSEIDQSSELSTRCCGHYGHPAGFDTICCGRSVLRGPATKPGDSVRLWSVEPGVARDNLGLSRTRMQQIRGHLASSTDRRSVAYNDRGQGPLLVTLRSRAPHRLLVSPPHQSMSVARQATPAEDRAATQRTDRPSGRWQADSVACSHVIA